MTRLTMILNALRTKGPAEVERMINQRFELKERPAPDAVEIMAKELYQAAEWSSAISYDANGWHAINPDRQAGYIRMALYVLAREQKMLETFAQAVKKPRRPSRGKRK